MELEEWSLIASVVFTGLWSGLFAMLNTVLHPVMRGMSGPQYREFMGAFLPVARRAPFNYIEVAGMVIAPTVALIAFDGSTEGTVVALTAIGLGLTIAGPLLVSNRLAEPNYDVILGWDPDAPPAGWEQVRERYFTLNWIRAAATWAAFGLLLAALVEQL